MKRSNYLIEWTKLDYYITKGVILKTTDDELNTNYEFVLLRSYENFKGIKRINVINNKNSILQYHWDEIELYDVMDEQAFDFIVSDEPDTDDVVDNGETEQPSVTEPTNEDKENSDTPPTESSGDENVDDSHNTETPINETTNDKNSQDNTNTDESDPYSQFE